MGVHKRPMRNRAKCKLCEDVIESFHQHDYVTCRCGEITIDGGLHYWKCSALHWENFLRVDDENNIIIPTIIDINDTDTIAVEENSEEVDRSSKPSKEELLDMLAKQLEDLEKLPSNALINRDQLCLSLYTVKCLFEVKDGVD